MTLKKKSAGVACVLALALTVPLLAATSAIAAPAPGEVLRSISNSGEAAETRQDVDTADATSSNPVTLTGLGQMHVFGSDFDPTTRLEYLVTASGSLVSVNSLTGVVKETVPLVKPAGWTDEPAYYDLDIDSTGLAHILLRADGTSDHYLATVNLTNGIVTLLGEISGTFDGELMGLASSPSGVFYATDRYQVHRLAVTPAGVSVVDSSNLFSNRDDVALSADFDSNGVLWLNTYSDGDATDLWSLDVTTPRGLASHAGEFSTAASAIHFVTPVAPVATLSASSVATCGQITVTGANFTPSVPVALRLNDLFLDRVAADAAGAVSFTATIPADAAAGINTLTLADSATGDTAVASVTIAGTACVVPPVVTPPVVVPPVVVPPVVTPPVVTPPVVTPPVVTPPVVTPPVVTPPVVNPEVPTTGTPTPVVPAAAATAPTADKLAETGMEAGAGILAAATALLLGLGFLVVARRRTRRA